MPTLTPVFDHLLQRLPLGHPLGKQHVTGMIWRCVLCGVENKSKCQYVGHPCKRAPVAVFPAEDDDHA